MFELHSIERACERVPGGLKRIDLIDPRDLATPAAWNVSMSLDSLDFLPGKSAYSFEKDILSGRLEGDHDTGSIAGDYFAYKLSASVRAIRPTMESLRAKVRNRRIHLVATYQDDLKRLVPYMRLAIRDDSGTTWSDKQGYQIVGNTRLIMPGPGIGGNIETAPGESGGDGGTTPTTGVEPVVISTSESTYTYTIPVGKWLVGWELRSDDDQSGVSLGLTSGGTELGGPVDLAALQSWAGNANMIPTFTSTPIYFSGLTGTNTIKLWLLG
ncbi:MAG: hypothetical protein JNM22_05615 [Saprospiraceae bacterium]|nr:hypothetical protein [Saprospiraceae bacterium]